MLTIIKGTTVEEIRIPDCTPNGKHPDGDDQVLHVAGMLIVEPAPGGSGQIEVERVSLLDPSGSALRVVFEGKTAGKCEADPSLQHTVALNALTDHGNGGATKLRPAPGSGKKDPVAASIHLVGGTLKNDPAYLSKEVYDLPSDDASTPIPSHRIPLLKFWKPQQGPVTVTVRNAENDRVFQKTLDDGQSVFVFNWDKGEPRDPDEYLEFPQKVCNGSNAVDVDFKWLYQLLITPGDDWDKWRRGKPLPAPTAQCTTVSEVLRDLRTPGGSDCIDAVWRE